MRNDAWFLLSLVALATGLLINQAGLTVLGALMLSVFGIAWGWNRWALWGVAYERRLSERRAFLGETITLEISVTNRKLLPLAWLHVQDDFPAQLTLLDAELAPSAQPNRGYLNSLLSLRWFERVRWRLRLCSESRGIYYLGPARLAAGDLFGLLRCDEERAHRDVLVVYPRLYSLEALGLPPKEPFGETRSPLRILEDPGRTVGVRDYGPGDPLKRVHWKATARRQALQVRVYEPTTQRQLLVCLNVSTLPNNWQGIVPEMLEAAVSVAATLAKGGDDCKYQVGLLANGCWPLSDQPLKVLPGRSPYQLTHILEALAAIQGLPTARLADLMMKESAHLPWGATLVVVTAVLEDDLAEAMVRLRVAGRRVVLLSLDPQQPREPLPGVLCYRLCAPVGEQALIRFEAVAGEGGR